MHLVPTAVILKVPNTFVLFAIGFFSRRYRSVALDAFPVVLENNFLQMTHVYEFLIIFVYILMISVITVSTVMPKGWVFDLSAYG